MELGLTLTLCGLGAAFLLPALIMGCNLLYRRKKCTAEGCGLVIDIRVRHSSDNRSLHPVYEYWVDGVRYTSTGGYMSNRVPPVGVRYTSTGGYMSNRVPPVGTQVDIRYDPNNPRNSYIFGYDDKVLRILCAVFSVVGLIPFAVCIAIALTLR